MQDMRGHREGSLFQRKSGPGKGQWVALVTMRDGRRASRWAKTRDEAKAELAELLRLRDAGAPLTGRVRLGAYLERWVNEPHGWAPATRRKHESIVRVHLIPALGHLRLAELSVRDVDRFLAHGGGPRTRSHFRATLRVALAGALRDGLAARNVAALARPVQQHATERTILDAAQARILIESTRTTRYGPLWTILVTTGLRISEALGLAWSDVDLGGNDGRDDGPPGRDGAVQDLLGRHQRPLVPGDGPNRRHMPVRRDRQGSVVGPSITVRHQLAREDGEWVRRPPKTAKGRRTVPLTPLGVEALRAQRAMQREWRLGDASTASGDVLAMAASSGDSAVRPDDSAVRPGDSQSQGGDGEVHRGPTTPGTVVPIDGLVFTSPTGAPLHETNTLKALQADLHAAGLPRVTQHDLRHSCATLLYSMGIPMPAIADILGHADARITEQLYRHHVKEFSTIAAEKMQEALG